MFIIEAKNGGGTAKKSYKRLAYARKEAARVASAGKVYIHNTELWPWQRWFKVETVRLFDTRNPDIDIDF